MKNEKSILYYLGLLSQIGLVIVVNILVSLGVYKLIEKFLFENVFLLLILLLIGVVSGFYSAYKLININGDFNENR